MTEVEMDRVSRPLREAAQRWAREHGLGYSGGWDQKRRRWSYELATAPRVTILVEEDGSRATVEFAGAVGMVATTPTGLRRVLSRVLERD